MLAGESGVTITLPANNTQINLSTYTCTMVVGSPSGGNPKSYSATPSGDGTSATYVTNGSEFPIAGTYTVELHAKSGSNYYKSRTSLLVGDSYP